MFRVIDDAAFAAVCKSLWWLEWQGVSRRDVFHTLDLSLAGWCLVDAVKCTMRGQGFLACLVAALGCVFILVAQSHGIIPVPLPRRRPGTTGIKVFFALSMAINLVCGRIPTGLFDASMLLREYLLSVPPKPPRKRNRASELTPAPRLVHVLTGARVPA